MGKVRYRPYSSRKKKSKSVGRIIISIVLIAAIYMAIKWMWGKDETEQVSPDATVKLADVGDEPRAVVNLDEFEAEEETKEPLNPVREDSYTVTVVETQDAVDKAITNLEASSQTTQESAVENVSLANEEELTEDDLEMNDEAVKLMQEANQDIMDGKIISARFKLNSALRMPLTNTQRNNIKKKLTELADLWLFSDAVLEGDKWCYYYKVQPGDLLSTIGKAHNVPWEFLLKINNISRPENLRAGQRIKVVKGPFHAIVNRSQFTLDLYLQQTFVKTYSVGLGKESYSTPTGMWMVKNQKLISPNWTDPDTGKLYDATDPDYPLGKRWIGLKGISGDAIGRTGFALHGTNEPKSIGHKSSRGCIRLLNEDVLEVYDLMTPNQSQVQVKD